MVSGRQLSNAMVRIFWHRHARRMLALCFFFFNDTATTEIYTLSLHDALPISCTTWGRSRGLSRSNKQVLCCSPRQKESSLDRKSTRLNSSHSQISYAVFCLKKTPPPRQRRADPAADRRRCN